MEYGDFDQDYHHQDQPALPPLHHVGFFGHPVYTKSSTPPATSLAIIRGVAKFQHITSFDSKNKLRIGCLIHNASVYVDPVIYRGDKTILERYSGSRLQDQVTGATKKVYQDFGNWWEDTYYVDEDMPELDPFNPDEYKDTEIMFNGVTWNELAPSSDDIVAKARATDDVMFWGAIKRYNNASERCKAGVGMSRLSQIVLPEDVVRTEASILLPNLPMKRLVRRFETSMLFQTGVMTLTVTRRRVLLLHLCLVYLRRMCSRRSELFPALLRSRATMRKRRRLSLLRATPLMMERLSVRLHLRLPPAMTKRLAS